MSGRRGIGRRELLLLSATLAAWPLRTRAQQRVPILGVLMGGGQSTRPDLIEALVAGLATENWFPPSNITLEVRGAQANRALAAAMAAELISLDPAAIVANTTVVAEEVLRLTRTIPVVFMPVGDPVGSGFVESYARPGGNATGFTNFEPSHVGKWLELLLSVRPDLLSIGLMYNPDTSPRRGDYYLEPFLELAGTLGFEPVPMPVLGEVDIAPAMASLAERSGSGLVVPADVFMITHRLAVIAAVASHRLPAIYPFINYTDDGGLMSYSIDTVEIFRRGGAYLGRILNGASPATLPVQSPERFQLVINLRTAREQGFTIPLQLLAIADRVIE